MDVFTDRAFGGNPLAVVLDAGGLSTAQMQAIATEFNYSETTFVLPPRDSANDAQVRIFTVNREIPFAGHPNVTERVVPGRHTAVWDQIGVPLALRRERADVVLHPKFTVPLGTATRSVMVAAAGMAGLVMQSSRRAASGSGQLSRFTALSCQRFRSQWESMLVARKIAMPVIEIIASAANMRGILSWYPDSRIR